MQDKDYTRIETKPAAEEAWRKLVLETGAKMLWYETESSWYTGSNVPGKPVEVMGFSAGIPLYSKKCAEAADQGYQAFELS